MIQATHKDIYTRGAARAITLWDYLLNFKTDVQTIINTMTSMRILISTGIKHQIAEMRDLSLLKYIKYSKKFLRRYFYLIMEFGVNLLITMPILKHQ